MSALYKKKGSGCCVAFGCSMRKGTNLLSAVQLFKFPKNPERRLRWEIAVHRENWKATANSQLCNLHFVSGKPSTDPQHPDYVPSIFSHQKEQLSKTDSVARYDRLVKRIKIDTSHSNGKPSSDPLHPDYVPSISSYQKEQLSKTDSVARCGRLVKRIKIDTSHINERRKDGKFCSVPQCSSKGWEIPRCSFHFFPHEFEKNPAVLNRRTRWILALKMGKEITNNMVVCSRHFKSTDFIKNSSGKSVRLKKTAIPSQNLPVANLDASESIETKRKLEDLKLTGLNSTQMNFKNFLHQHAKSSKRGSDKGFPRSNKNNLWKELAELRRELLILKEEKRNLENILFKKPAE